MPTLIAETTFVQEAMAEEQSLPPGSYEIRFYSPNPVAQDVLYNIADTVVDNGVDVKEVYQDKSKGLWYVGVRYLKHPASESIGALPVAVIPLIAFGFISTLIGIGIFKVQDIARSIGMLALIIFGGSIVLAAVLRKPLERAAEAYVRKY